MRKRLRDALQVLVVFTCLCTGARWLMPSSSQPPQQYTGAPGDSNGAQTCTACHASALQTNSASLTVSGLPASWSANTDYSLTLTLSAGTRRGFEMTAESSNGTKRGAWTAGSNSTVIGANWIGQTNASSLNSWTFTWRSPAAGAGTISFYAVGNAANNNGSADGGDIIHQKIISVTETVTTPAPSITTLSPTFGSAAESVSFTGANFVGIGSTVTFGAANANCSSGSDTSFTCAVPAGASASDGNVNVTMTSANGTSAAKTFSFIKSAPAPTAVSPTFGASTDSARAFTLTGNLFSKTPTAVKLTRTAQTSITATGVSVSNSGSLTGTLDLTGAATGQWNVAVTNPDAQTGTFSNGFQIQALPVAPGIAVGVPTSTGSIHWEWADNSDNEDNFLLLTQSGATIATLPAGSTFYEETGLQGNAQTSRKVRASNIIGVADSPSSSTYTYAAAPTAPAVNSVGISSQTYSWVTGDTAGTTYVAEVASGSFSANAVLQSSVTLNSNAATFLSLSANTTFFFRVKARSYDNTDTGYTTQIASPTLANPPTGTSLLAVFASSAILTCNTTSNPAGTVYRVDYSTALTFTGSAGSIGETTTSFPVFLQLYPNVTWYFRIQAVNHAGIASNYDLTQTTITLAELPGTPAAIARGSDTLTVAWDAGTVGHNFNPPGTLYTVTMSTSDFGSVVGSSETIAQQSTFSGLLPSTSYFFRVKATNVVGKDTASTPTGVGRTASINVAAPTGVVATTLGTSSISWTWNSVALAASYDLYAASNTQNGAAFATGVVGLTFQRTNLSTNTAYAIRIAAVNADSEEGVLSSSVTLYTFAAVPTGTSVLVLSSTSLQVQWDADASTSHSLERSTHTGSGYSQIATPAAQFADTGLAASTTYFYRVRGFNGDGVATAYSLEATGLTLPPSPAVPVVSGIALSSDSIRWSWTYSGATVSTFTVLTSTQAVIADLSGTTTFYIETGLAPRTVYQRSVRAVNPTGSASGAATTSTPDSAAAVPAAAAVTITAPDAGTRLDIPGGALGGAGQAGIALDPVNAPLLPGTPSLILAANTALPETLKGPLSSIREFIAVVDGVRFTATFTSPVTIRIPYPDANADGLVDGVTPSLSADNLAMYTLDETTQRWVPLTGSSVDKPNKVVTGTVTHFSIFTLLGPPAAKTLSGLKVYPNPWRPGSGGGYDAAAIKFKNLTDTAMIKIFTVAGVHVKTLEKTSAEGDEKIWDGTNDSGSKVASGVYLYQVTSSAGNKTGRLAIIR